MGTISASTPGVDLLAVATVATVAMTLVLLMVILVKMIRQRRASRSLIGWAIAGGAVLALLALTVSVQLPLKVRFANAESDFERVIEECVRRPSSDACLFPGRVGSYSISTVAERNNGDFVFYLEGLQLEDSGFYYSVSGTEPTPGPDFETPKSHRLSDDWFSFVAGF